MTQGFPLVPFFVNEDLTRADGVVSCREITTEEMLKMTWRALRALKLLTKLPVVP